MSNRQFNTKGSLLLKTTAGSTSYTVWSCGCIKRSRGLANVVAGGERCESLTPSRTERVRSRKRIVNPAGTGLRSTREWAEAVAAQTSVDGDVEEQ